MLIRACMHNMSNMVCKTIKITFISIQTFDRRDDRILQVFKITHKIYVYESASNLLLKWEEASLS